MSSSSSGDQQPGAYQVSNSAREFLQLQRLGVRDENILGHPSSASHTSSSHNTPPEHRAADRNRRPPDDRVRHSWQWPWDMAMENDVIDASVQSSEEWAQKERIRKKRKMIRRGICLAIVALAIVLGVIFAVLGAIQKNDESITSANPPPTTKNEGITSTNPPLGKKVDQTSAREIQLTPKLEHLLSDKSDFPPPSSQHAALVWLANEDPARIDTSDQVRLEVRFVLATLYFSMGGDRWDDKIQFLSGLNECKWKNEATGKGVTCNEEGEVTSVILNDNNLQGFIPFEIQRLSSLTLLDLSQNAKWVGWKYEPALKDSSTLETLGFLTNLKTLKLSMNWIDFIIPTQFGLLTNLETLDLSVNEFMQTIPQELSQLTKLKELFLNENKLKGGSDGDVFESMKSLEVLDLSWNEKLKFPDTFLYPMSLKELYLRGISDTSRISTHIGRLSNLEVLDISENGLIGTVPTEIGHMTSLLELYLEDNSFSGTFPSSIDQSQLNRLGLDDNFLDPDK